MFRNITETLAIGSVSDVDGLAEIASKGYKTVIDLCTVEEGNQLEQATVQKLGLQYVSVPVSAKNLNDETLQTFTQAINSSSQPIYTRCASGLRAGVFTLLNLAERENWTETEYLQQREALEIPSRPNCPLASFSHNYFDQKS